MLTVLIKTFKRPQICKRLTDSIKKYYPDLPVIVLEDYEDTGVSKGRNTLVDMCQTKYCFILDDDCIFTAKTDIEKAISILEARDLDILEVDAGLNYHGLFETKDNVVRYLKGDRNGLYDFVTQIFIAKTDKLRECRWDERLKIGEHFAFFYKHQGKLKIGRTDEVKIIHDHVNVNDYPEYRYRALEYVKSFMKENGIIKRIDLNNNTITL